jgi:hypothetical protein
MACVARYQQPNLPVAPPCRTEGVNHRGHSVLGYAFGLVLISCGRMVCLGHTRFFTPCCVLQECPPLG